MMKKISIIGYGRFGKTLHRLLKDDFDITIFTRKGDVSLEKAYESDVIFYAVPISSFEETIEQHKQYFKPNHLLIDVLSVKMHPAHVLAKHLEHLKTQALLTHPMFGPDSSKDGFEGLPMILDKFKTDNQTYEFWKKYFENKKLRVIEMTAEEHDKTAAD